MNVASEFSLGKSVLYGPENAGLQSRSLERMSVSRKPIIVFENAAHDRSPPKLTDVTTSFRATSPRAQPAEQARFAYPQIRSRGHLLRIERQCTFRVWGEQSSTKSKTGLSAKQFRLKEAR